MGWTEKLAQIKTELKALNAAIPDTAAAFGALGKSAKSGDTLDTKTLELIALAISVADRCEPCIEFHTEALVRLGATRAEVTDTLAMCIQMGGGPSLMYAAKALACYEELSA